MPRDATISGIARPDSNYSGMHTVVLLKAGKEDGRDYVLGIDLDVETSAHAELYSIALEGCGQC